MSWDESINRGALALVRADYVEAESSLIQALVFAQQNFDQRDLRLHQTLSLLGQTYFKLGNCLQTQKYLDLTTALKEPTDRLRVAVDHLSLAQLNSEAGPNATAQKHFEHALHFLKTPATTSEKSNETAIGLQKILQNVQRREVEETTEKFRSLLSEAKSKREQNEIALEKLQSYFGPEPDAIVDAWQSLIATSSNLMQSGSIENLIAAFRNSNSALRIAISIFPDNHWNIASSIVLLANICSKLGLNPEADELFDEAQRIANLNPNDPLKMATIELSRAHFCACLDNYEGAIACLSAATRLIEREVETSIEFASTKLSGIASILSTLLQKAQIYKGARNLIKQAIEYEGDDQLEQANLNYDNSLVLLETVLGRTHLEVAQVLNFQSNLLVKMNRIREAETIQERAALIEAALTKRSQDLDDLISKLPAIRLR